VRSYLEMLSGLNCYKTGGHIQPVDWGNVYVNMHLFSCVLNLLPHQGGNEIVFSVHLRVSTEYLKKYERIFIKFSGGMRCGQRKN